MKISKLKITFLLFLFLFGNITLSFHFSKAASYEVEFHKEIINCSDFYLCTDTSLLYIPDKYENKVYIFNTETLSNQTIKYESPFNPENSRILKTEDTLYILTYNDNEFGIFKIGINNTITLITLTSNYIPFSGESIFASDNYVGIVCQNHDLVFFSPDNNSFIETSIYLPNISNIVFNNNASIVLINSFVSFYEQHFYFYDLCNNQLLRNYTHMVSMSISHICLQKIALPLFMNPPIISLYSL
ncbi:MAG: hypothetical protein ACTSQE_09180 [Candidatus Heimdallarchaeaceae archaeon]